MENSLNAKYLNIIKKCRFVPKPDEWFVEGETCNFIGVPFGNYEKEYKFHDKAGYFEGLTNETFTGYTGDLSRMDGETCVFEEFYIYDEYDNEISELTLEEYIVLLRDQIIDYLV